MRLPGPLRERSFRLGSSVRRRAVGFAGFDHGVKGAGHLCSGGGVGLAAQIWIVAILPDVALECQPQRTAQASIAIFGDLDPAAQKLTETT